MAQTKLGEQPANTNGNLPELNSTAPDFILTGTDMKEIRLRDYAGKNVVLNIFPSVDTSVCASSVREFNKRAASLPDTVVLNIAKDLPFAMKRFCATEGIQHVYLASDFRNLGFGKNYGTELVDSAFAGLFARAVVVINKQGKVAHTQLVPQIGDEPDYDSAIKALN
ncbi:MAG: thiol peroxidase [Cyclobacteriaceae bacterium]|nr:thiol peroxidase [Cyclobacteriaceae bacterium]